MDTDARLLILGGLAFTTGLLVGLGTGLLMAPASGARTRRRITDFVEDLQDDATQLAGEAKDVMGDAIDGVIDRGKKIIR